MERIIDRIKAFGVAAKEVFFYVVTPILLVLGMIYYLLNRNTELKNELVTTKGEEKLDELKEKQKEVDSSATGAVDAFEEFRRRSGDVQGSGGSSNSGSKSSN